MAVALLGGPTKRYIGTAAERAAMSTTGVPAGSKFTESDTSDTYVWNGSVWSLYTISGGELWP